MKSPNLTSKKVAKRLKGVRNICDNPPVPPEAQSASSIKSWTRCKSSPRADLKKITDIPVFFHNLSGYDGHIIFQNLTKIDSVKEPEVVAKTMEKFVTFSIGNLKFKDSLQFLNSSLDKLVKNLAAKSNAFNHLKEYILEKWGHLSEEAFQM